MQEGHHIEIQQAFDEHISVLGYTASNIAFTNFTYHFGLSNIIEAAARDPMEIGRYLSEMHEITTVFWRIIGIQDVRNFNHKLSEQEHV